MDHQKPAEPKKNRENRANKHSANWGHHSGAKGLARQQRTKNNKERREAQRKKFASLRGPINEVRFEAKKIIRLARVIERLSAKAKLKVEPILL